MTRLLNVIMAMMCCLAAMAQSLEAQLDSLLLPRYNASAPGFALVIARGDTILYERYRGMADLEKATPISAATLFNIASVSKQFTAVGILQLYNQGALDIDMPMALYFPEYRHPLWQTVTPRHFLSHSSGIPDLRSSYSRDEKIYATDSTAIEYLSTVDSLKFAPGTAYDYINPTYTLLGSLIERRSGLEFEAYQSSQVFARAGLVCDKDIEYFNPSSQPSPGAHGYIPFENQAADGNNASRCYKDSEGRSWMKFDYGEETFFATRPDGGIYATARAMARWDNALLKGKVVPPDLLQMARSPHITVSSSPWCDYQNRPNTAYGLGWFIDTTPGRETKIYHTGDNGGFQAYLASYPASGITVVMLENRNDLDRWTTQLAIERLLLSHGLIK